MHILLWIISFFFSASAFARTVSCFDEETAFSFSSPTDWKAVYEPDLGPCAFFVPNSFDFNSTPIRFYPNMVPSGESLSDFIKGDLDDYRQRYPQMQSRDLPPVKNKNGIAFILKRVSGGNPPFVEEIAAYNKTKNSVLIVVLSSRDKTMFTKYEPVFMRYLEDVVTKPRKALFGELKSEAVGFESKKPESNFVTQYMSAIGSKLGQAAGKCLKGSATTFGQVFQVDENGLIVTWMNDTNTAASKCIEEAMFGVRGPKPPLAAFPFFIEWKTKKK